MLAVVSPVRSTKDESKKEEMESFNSMVGTSNDDVEFGDLSEGNLLESINFDDLFVGIDVDGDVLPDLEVDGDVFAKFSADLTAAAAAGGEDSKMTTSVENCGSKGDNNDKNHDDAMVVSASNKNKKEDNEDKSSNSSSDEDSGRNFGTSLEEEIVSKRDESVMVNPTPKDGGKGRKSSSHQSKGNPQGKRKVKVDWTPELHRRFVQAVEQLGVEKAVPSRILETMGIECLTRHNIASHLQKYRSHRKHLLAREAEGANWSQRRQMYGGGGGKRDVIPFPAPTTMGFPPITLMHHFRPLHVWGHPSMDQSFMHMWPKHPLHSVSPPPVWVPPVAPPPPPSDPSFWHAQDRAPNALTPGTPCFPQPLTKTRFGSSPPTVPGIPPHGIGVPGRPRPLVDFHPSKESIDEAIGDVLSKPWLPLPLGLKAPALDSVMSELQRQGIRNIPPSCA